MSIEPRPERPERRYDHVFHAGNTGDVWKHVALLALLRRADPEVVYLESHAGAGRYQLGPTGEWREGVARLVEAERAGMPEAVRRYVEAVLPAAPPVRGFLYRGSPLLAASALGSAARLVLYELAPAPRRELEAALRGDARAVVRDGDGMAALAAGFAEDGARERPAVVLVDPPFVEKQEWTALPRALGAAAQALPRATLAAWYPIKSHTRPNAMLAAIGAAGAAGVALELVTAPLAQRKNRLAGSGVVLLRPPEGLVEELGAAAGYLGPRLCLHPGHWTVRLHSWGA